MFFDKKRYVAHNVHQLLFRIRFFVCTKFSMPDVSHMYVYRIYDLRVLFTCSSVFLTSGPTLLICYRPRTTLIRHWLPVLLSWA